MNELHARLQFLLGKATQTPSADQWKHWPGGNKEYVSKNQKKKQQGAQELCLLTLADLDFFFKAGKRAVDRGQNYDNWLNGAGRKMFLSWSARAASEPNLEPFAPVARPGDPSSVRVGDFFSDGVSQPSSSPGVAAGYPPSLSRGGNPTPDLSGGASGSTGISQLVLNMSVPNLARILQNVNLMEYLGKQNSSQ